MNLIKLKQDRKALDERLRQIKAELRTTWTRPMGDLQVEHLRLKREATELCILRAWLRGKPHNCFLRPEQGTYKDIAERRLRDYQALAA